MQRLTGEAIKLGEDMNIQLKKVSHNSRLSEETEAFAAMLYIDGKKAAEVRNSGQGCSNMFHWYDQDAHKAFDAYLKTLPPDMTYPDTPLAIDGDIFVGDLLSKHLMLKTYKRWIKKHNRTAYRLKTQKKGEFTIWALPYTPEVKARLEKEFGDNLDMIVNEFVKENE